MPVPVTLLPLCSDLPSAMYSHFAPLFDRAAVVLTVTESERQVVSDSYPSKDVVAVGPPLAANPSVWREPNPYLGENDYLVVLTDAPLASTAYTSNLARLVRLAFPYQRVAIVATDAFDVWLRGNVVRSAPITRGSDLLRLMAWARTTIDLAPGSLVARRCVESLLYATPILVPEGSKAHEHARLGCGGLWFETSDELVRCVDAVLDSNTAEELGKQGQGYAESKYGSTQSFIRQVSSVVEATTR